MRLIDLAPASTHPHRTGYVLQTFLAQCQNLSPAAWPDIPAAGGWQLLSSPVSQCAALPSGTVCWATCPPALSQVWGSKEPASRCVSWLQHRGSGLFPTMSPNTQICLQDQSRVWSYSLEKKKHERTEPFVNEVMQSYSQFCLPELDDLKNLFAYFFQPVSNILESHLLLQTSFWSSVESG